jgi:hypothetical protein
MNCSSVGSAHFEQWINVTLIRCLMPYMLCCVLFAVGYCSDAVNPHRADAVALQGLADDAVKKVTT